MAASHPTLCPVCARHRPILLTVMGDSADDDNDGWIDVTFARGTAAGSCVSLVYAKPGCPELADGPLRLWQVKGAPDPNDGTRGPLQHMRWALTGSRATAVADTTMRTEARTQLLLSFTHSPVATATATLRRCDPDVYHLDEKPRPLLTDEELAVLAEKRKADALAHVTAAAAAYAASAAEADKTTPREGKLMEWLHDKKPVQWNPGLRIHESYKGPDGPRLAGSTKAGGGGGRGRGTRAGKRQRLADDDEDGAGDDDADGMDDGVDDADAVERRPSDEEEEPDAIAERVSSYDVAGTVAAADSDDEGAAAVARATAAAALVADAAASAAAPSKKNKKRKPKAAAASAASAVQHDGCYDPTAVDDIDDTDYLKDDEPLEEPRAAMA